MTVHAIQEQFQVNKILESPSPKLHNPKISLVDPLIQTVLDVRQQGQLLCNYLAPVELPSLLYTMSLCTVVMMSFFLVLNGVSSVDSEDWRTASTNLMWFLLLSLRLYIKSFMAQQVTDEVSPNELCENSAVFQAQFYLILQEEQLGLKLMTLSLESSAAVREKVGESMCLCNSF